MKLLVSCVATATLLVLVGGQSQKMTHVVPTPRPWLRMEYDCNLQVGAPGERLPIPVAVSTKPGARITFRSPDLGTFVESGSGSATVVADAAGVAEVGLRLGPNVGLYTVIASPEKGEEPQVLYHFQALPPRVLAERSAKLGRVTGARGHKEVGR